MAMTSTSGRTPRPTPSFFVALAVIASVVVSGDRAAACMFADTIILVNIVRPGDPAAFDRGALGVLQPTYERRYLIRAYRRLHGLDTVITSTPESPGRIDQPRGWLDARESVLRTGQKVEPWRFQTDRPLTNFATFGNCTDETFTAATRTLEARVRQFGDRSPIVAAWIRAQDAVFANCGGSGTVSVVLPDAASAGTDALARADRAYQTAAATFYAMQYEEAAARFQAIAADASSPWRPYGQYLAARSLIRRASVAMPEAGRAERDAVLDRADRMLAAVESDASAFAALRSSATGLRGLIGLRVRPVQRMRELSSRLIRAGAVAQQDLTDYLLGFDAQLSPETEYDYAQVDRRDEYANDDDLTDWLLALQGTGPGARDRAFARWSDTRATHWLVAALWKADPRSEAAPDLMRAAGAIDPTAPAYGTLAFLRARLLIARGDTAEAVGLLASLPDQPSPTMPAEAVNLFRALRLQIAPDLDAWLRAAPRWPASSGDGFASSQAFEKPSTEVSFDVDVALALTESFPVDRLVEAVATSLLPPRLRLIVASEAWTRAVQLRQDDAGRRAAEIVKALSPVVRADMDRYLAATDSETRHYLAILTLLKWPTFRNYVPLAEGTEAGFYPPRFEGHSQNFGGLRRFWWCGFGQTQGGNAFGPYAETPVTRLPEIVYQSGRIPPPAVVSAADRLAATREFAALAALGAAPNYLSREAIAWARARPKDRDVPEALARAVTSTRYGCGDQQTGALSRQAFTILHRQYPATEWAKRTKYWYANQY